MKPSLISNGSISMKNDDLAQTIDLFEAVRRGEMSSAKAAELLMGKRMRNPWFRLHRWLRFIFG